MTVHANKQARIYVQTPYANNPENAIVKKIYAAKDILALKQVIRDENVGKIIVHPAFVYGTSGRPSLNVNAYDKYNKSITALFKEKADSKNTLVIYQNEADYICVNRMFTRFDATIDPQYWIIHGQGSLNGDGNDYPEAIVRAMANGSSSFVIGGLYLNACIKNYAIPSLRDLLKKIGTPDFPFIINRLITNTCEAFTH